MDIVRLIHGYFKKYTDAPNPALIRDIISQIAEGSPNKSEFDIYLETIGKLRNDFGYSHPIEEQADRADAAPFLAELSRRRSSKERE